MLNKRERDAMRQTYHDTQQSYASLLDGRRSRNDIFRDRRADVHYRHMSTLHWAINRDMELVLDTCDELERQRDELAAELRAIKGAT